jgi:hypothetical protein
VAVYVDDAYITATVGRHASRWCHLTADTQEELHEFAARIGLRRDWFQNEGKSTWHYDVTAGKRRQAVAAGAQEITWREMGALVTGRWAAERNDQAQEADRLAAQAGDAWRRQNCLAR